MKKADSNKRTIEILLLVIISFSPLVPNTIRVSLILLLVASNLTQAKVIGKRQMLVFVLLFGAFSVSTVNDLANVRLGSFSVLNIYFPLCFVLGFIISQKYSLREYLWRLEKVVFVMAVFSLVGVFVYTLFPTIVYRLPTYNYYHTSHKTALLFNVLLSNNQIVQRNAGIAWEPGAFQFLLNLGLYSHIKLNEKSSTVRFLVYALALISTKSTAGLPVFLIITYELAKESRLFRIFAILTVVAFFDFIREEFLYHYYFKLFGSQAFLSRLTPMANAFETGLKNLLGLGNTKYDLVYREFGLGAFDSFGQIIVRYGLPLLAVIAYLLFKILQNDRTLFVIITVTFLSQTVWHLPVITPFYFMIFPKSDKGGLRENTMDHKHSLARS